MIDSIVYCLLLKTDSLNNASALIVVAIMVYEPLYNALQYGNCTRLFFLVKHISFAFVGIVLLHKFVLYLLRSPL